MGIEEIIAKMIQDVGIDAPQQVLPEPDMVSFLRLEKSRKYYIDSGIDGSIMALQRKILLCNQEDLGKSIDKRQPITIYIMSPGGCIDFMYMLIDTILLSQTPVYTVNIGCAASAAALIFLAGHKRFMMPRARILIHEGSAALEGDAGKVMDAADTYKKDIKRMKDFILERTGIPKALMSKKHSNDWSLTAQECLEYNVCDRIIESLDEIA